MSTIDEIRIQAFHEFINTCRFPFPLCQGHALEIIAALNDFYDWNELCQNVAVSADYKLQAKRLREHVKTEGLTLPLTISQARRAIAATTSS